MVYQGNRLLSFENRRIFQMGKRKSDKGIFYKLSIGRKNELLVGGKDLYIQLIRYRNDWSIYKKYKLRDCRIIKEKNIFIMMEKAINRKIVWVFHMSMANGS